MATVSSGQTQEVSSGQTVSSTLVLNGGIELIDAGGIADATLLSGVLNDTRYLQIGAAVQPGTAAARFWIPAVKSSEWWPQN